MRGVLAARAGLAALVGVAVFAPAPAVAQVSGYDGKNPFRCVLQQVGTGTAFPRPNDDPFCVEYDKRHQNVTQLGVVEFLSQEPARVAAASPKCFYFQRDHWVGSVEQGNPSTETYSWDGSYYFDKAKGTGGVYVENFTFNNQTGDPRTLPGFPEDYKPYFGPGKGGVQRSDALDADPRCVEKAKKDNPYRPAGGSPGSGTGGPRPRHCKAGEGSISAGIGPLRLNATKGQVRERAGSPHRTKSGFWRYCVRGGGRLMAGFRGGRSPRVEFVFTSAPGFHAGEVHRGSSESSARRELRGEFELGRPNGTILLGVLSRSRTLVVAIRSRQVIGVAVAITSLSRAEIVSYYRRTA